MKQVGGFEGNAQTLHIVAKTEKKELMNGDIDAIDNNGHDQRLGLNWCFRSLAAIIKYDHVIPTYRSQEGKLEKGVYESDKDILDCVKNHVAPTLPTNQNSKQ